jgi:hypothetical protein
MKRIHCQTSLRFLTGLFRLLVLVLVIPELAIVTFPVTAGAANHGTWWS